MKFLYLPFFLFTSLIFSCNVYSQTLEKATITLNENTNSPRYIRLNSVDFDSSNLSNFSSLLFNLRPEDTWLFLRANADDLNMSHVRFQQLYKGLKVQDHIYVHHVKSGKIVSANGSFQPKIELDITPSISALEATDFALNYKEIGLAKDQFIHNHSELIVYIKKGKPYLSYCIEIASKYPVMNKNCYVDALSGQVLDVVNKMCSLDVPGIGHTQFSGIQNVITDSISPGNYQTIDASRSITTYDNSTVLPYLDDDNNWNNVNASQDEFSMDVHFGAEATYDFFLNNFNRDSYDDLGGAITNFTNDAGVGVNAYWSGGPMNEMHYGNGDENYFPVASLEIAGHELAHGVTEYAAGLIYSDESGALNESFSDIFGATIRFLRAPTFATWFIGDQLLRPGGVGELAFRNMANPNQFGNADCYGGLFFNAGDVVHYDSGIQNFWYYLLCDGGSGTNDIGNTYNVTSIGMGDAMRIAYRNLNTYLTPNSTFLDARLGSEQAAIDLFGLCSFQHLEVVKAWYAVGVGGPNTSFLANADFSIVNSFSCTAPFNVDFTSTYNVENYLWDFGDLTTSNLANPSHIYTTPGNYTVSLFVSNVSICPSSDTETVSNAVLIGNIAPLADFSSSNGSTNSPISFVDQSTLNPNTWFWNFGDGSTSSLQNPIHTYLIPGMYNVLLIATNCAGTDTVVNAIEVRDRFVMCTAVNISATSGMIVDSGDLLGNYIDNESCEIHVSNCADSLQVTLESANIELGYDFLRIFEGTAGVGAPVMEFSGNFSTTTFVIPGGDMVVQFTSDASVIDAGFVLSFSSIASGGSTGNEANFIIMTPSPNVYELVEFQDLSTSNVASWFWEFGDGFLSNAQYPSHVYSNAGTYTVTLTVTLCNGLTDVHTSIIVISEEGTGILEGDIAQVSVYPNPSCDQFTILLPTDFVSGYIELLDLSGRTIFVQEVSDDHLENIRIETASLAPGQYGLRISSKDLSQLYRSNLQIVR